jgi:ribokinase
MTPRVLVVGSVNVDYLLQVERLPSAGETVAGGQLRKVPGGKGGNAAAAAAALGADTTLIAAVGHDADGDQAVADLRGCGVRTDALQRARAETGAAIVLTATDGENMIAIAPGANAEVDAELARAAVAGRAAPGAVVVVNFEVPLPVIDAVAAETRGRGLALVVDPAPARPMSPELVSACTLLTPNVHEVEALGYSSADELVVAGAQAVAVTLGAEGCIVHRAETSPLRIPAFPVTVHDTVGAGDAFAAGAGVGLAEGLAIEGAVALAAAAGALATTGPGARGARLDRSAVEALVDAG